MADASEPTRSASSVASSTGSRPLEASGDSVVRKTSTSSRTLVESTGPTTAPQVKPASGLARKPEVERGGGTTTSSIARYTLRFPQAAAHLVDVEAVFPTAGRSTIEIMMPVWTPGSYLVREYTRHVEGLRATTAAGVPRGVEQVKKNRFRIRTQGIDDVVVRYQVYGREATVRTNFIDADYAVLTPAATLFVDAERLDRPLVLTVEPAPQWPDVAVALPRAEVSTSSHAFVAANFDAMVDAPVLTGRLDRRAFAIRGIPHEVVTVGGDGVWDHARAATDVEAIAAATIEMWGGIVPYERYLFLNVLNGSRGGLEHRASTVMMADPWAAKDERAYDRWTGLVTHEFFHAWNGKRLRPKVLGPFDFERESYVRTLWAVEGFTSYYDNLLRVRAGLLKPKAYLKQLSGDIERMARTPGRDVQSLDAASYNAWIKAYRPDENSGNTSVSYYTKGSLLGWILDARIRRATSGRRSLDDVMRTAYARFAGATGYGREGLIRVVAEVANKAVASWLDEAARTARPLDYGPALAYFGLRFAPEPPLSPGDDPVDRQARRKTSWIGLEFRAVDGRHIVAQVLRNGPAYTAGVNVDDEVIGLGGYRVIDPAAHLRRFEPGDEVTLLVARRGALRTIPITIGQRPRATWPIEYDPAASDAVAQRRRRWLGGAATPK